MASKAEQILNALVGVIVGGVDASVKRNSAVPEMIPPEGLVIVRDGDPGEPERALGGVGSLYYTHSVDVEIYVQHGDSALRDQLYDDLITEIGSALEGDQTLGGLIFGMTYGRPPVGIEPVLGSDDIKNGLVAVVLEYETQAAL